MEFPGFSAADLEIFAIPTFAERMGAVRSHLRPKLLALGEALAPELAARVGGPVFPHAAAHMRRRVNPPAETWVAFARDARGYKRWTHFRVAISERGVRVVVFVEADSDDKPSLAAALQAHAARLAADRALADAYWFTAADGSIPTTSLLGEEGIRSLGARLARLKTLAFSTGLWLPEADALGPPERSQRAALAAMERLRPLYLAGVAGAIP